MAVVTILPLAHLPSADTIYVSLFRDVSNASSVREQLLAGNPDFAYAFVDASTILSTSHVLAAVFRALNDSLNSRMKSRNVHSEIVFALSPNNNISQAFANFGLPPATSGLPGLLAIKVSTPESPVSKDAVEEHLASVIKGTPVAFNDENIASLRDLARIRKLYKIQTTEAGKKAGRKKGLETNGGSASSEAVQSASPPGNTNDVRELEAVVMGTMALRGS